MNNFMAALSQIKQNPMAFLSMRRFNIPQNMNKPEDIIQHLLDSGQVSHNQLNGIIQERNNPMLRQMYLQR